MQDLLTDETYAWQVGGNYVLLPPGGAHVMLRPMSQMLRDPDATAMIRTRAAEEPAADALPGRMQTGQWFEADRLWFKRAVFYEIHIRGFADGNDDGTGDLRGLTEKLDYLQWLGIDCIWLLPMYPSPLRDGGYDIADFYSIHPDYGTVEDFRTLIDAAHERGIRVIADLVMNHTSSDHPVVPGGALRSEIAQARLVRLVGHRHPLPRGADHLHRHRESRTGRGTRSPASTTGTASSRTSPT